MMLTALKDPVLRVRVRAAAAVINFAQGIDEEDIDDILMPYMDDLLRALFDLLKCDVRHAQEKALNAVSAIAETSEYSFGEYYDRFMPILRDILTSLSEPKREDRELRGLAMECVGILGSSVPTDKFRPDAQAIMGITSRVRLEPDDPQRVYMWLVRGIADAGKLCSNAQRRLICVFCVL